MRVEKATDRAERPEECDVCQTPKVKLNRYYSFGPGHHVEWLCCYCRLDFTHGDSAVVKSIAGMLHELEKRLPAAKCSHTNKKCVYESDDGEFERWECGDCWHRWGVEIAQ